MRFDEPRPVCIYACVYVCMYVHILCAHISCKYVHVHVRCLLLK